MLPIQNATNGWTKFDFLPALYKKSAKLFVSKLCQNARIYNKLMLYETRAL